MFPRMIKFLPRRRFVFLWLALQAAGVASPARAQTFSASLDRDTIRLGESATLTLNFVGGSPQSLPNIPGVANLDIGFAGESSQVVIVNGERSVSRSFLYRVSAGQTGEFVIPPIQAQVNGNTLPSPPLKLKVVKNDLPAADLNQMAFTKLVVAKNEVYVGEVFAIEVQLFFQAGQDIQMPNLRCDGFTVTRMVPSQTRTQIGNTIYNVVVFKSLATAVKAGKLNFGPAECNITLRVPQGTPNDFLRAYSLQQASPTSEPQLINVLPLPPNPPPGFSGAVGSFSMVVNASPTNVLVGDPLALKVQIAGRGSLDNVLLPSFEQWHDFKTYAPTFKTEVPNQLEPAGIKSFEQIIIPQNAEIKELPAFAFSFFDPEQKTYRTLSQSAIALSVRPNNAAAQQPTILTNAAVTAGPAGSAGQIVHIKPYPGAVVAMQPPLLQQTWFVALQTVPVLAWVALFIRRRKLNDLARNPRLRRQLAVARQEETGLSQLRQLAGADRAEEFYELVFHLLQERLGERLDLPASAITEDVLEERLSRAEVTVETQTALRELFQACNQARFAHQPSGTELAAVIARLETALRALQQLKDAVTA